MLYRRLGRSDIQVSALGMGCWAIGGPWDWSNGRSMGWGEVDDAESIRAIHKALEMGVNFFDSAANYGAGHSERILGQALAGRREDAVIATKFGHIVDEAEKVVGEDHARVLENLRQDCENSLRRLNTDYIDLYQLHAEDYPEERAPALMEGLEELVSAGKIRWYGWSTDDPERAEIFAQGDHCASVQHRLNIFDRAEKMLEVCDDYDIASINKSPLGSGLLTGKYGPESKITDPKQWRQRVDFGEERLVDRFNQLEALREVLTSRGHTLAQAALAWIWAYHARAIPIPGFRNAAQVEENAGAATLGPLAEAQMQAIEGILAG